MTFDFRDKRSLTLLVYFGVAAAVAITCRDAPRGHFQTELDVIQANASRSLAEWLPDFGDTAMMISSKALAASGTLLPGVWFYHVFGQLLGGPAPAGHLAINVVFFLLASLSVAALGAALYGGPRGALAGVFFGLAPALGDLTAGFSNGPAILSFFWIAQAGLSYTRFIQDGNFGKLLATLMCVFLAVSSDGIGLFAVILIIGLELFQRRKGKPLKSWHRVTAVLICTGSAALFLGVLFSSKMIDLYALLTPILGPIRLFHALILGLKAMTLPSVLGRSASLFAVALGFAILLYGVYRSLEDKSRLMPVVLFPLALLMSFPDLLEPSLPRPDSAIAWLCPALCFALLLADLVAALNNTVMRTAAVAFLAVFMSLQAAGRAQIPIARGRQVREAADEMQRLLTGVRDESDIYLIDDGVDTGALVAGHLDFIYRYGLVRQARFSLVPGGHLFPDSARSPVGKLGAMTRLELNRGMVFIGWDRTHDGLVILNKLIDERLARADKLMGETRLRVEPLPLGGQGAVEAWQPRPGDEPIPAADETVHWFLESPIIRLHPTIGRYDMRYDPD